MESSSSDGLTLTSGASSGGASTGIATTGGVGDTTAYGSSDDACPFICEPDVSGLDVECGVAQQNCPAGEKCVWWAPEFGGPRREDARCVPVTGRGGPYEPCTLNEDYSDDCGPESYCLEVYGTADHGFCAPFVEDTSYSCDGYPGADAAVENGSDFPAACLYYECQPLIEGSCPEGMQCTFYPAWLYGSMHCWAVPLESDPVGAPCDYGGCGAGKLCAPAEWLPDCGSDRCCAEWCDLGAPACSTPGTSCELFPVWNYQDDPGFDTLGACVLPGAFE